MTDNHCYCYAFRPRRNRLAAFTLVELLVVIAIIGILVGLLLPAVQAAREAARKLQCQNNLKQLSLAMLNYESTHRQFPMAGAVDTDFSVQARLLPFMEQRALHDLLDYGQLAFTGPYNAKIPNPLFAQAFAQPLSVFLCPSDPAPEVTEVAVNGATYHYGGLNYMVSFGSGTGTHYDLRWMTDGVVYQHSTCGFSGITDGSSNTIFLSESVRSVGPDQTTAAGETPPFPYQATLNGSSGVSSARNATPGMTASGGNWSAYVDAHGMVADPDLESFWQTFTGWRGARSPALRGRGVSWAFSGAINSLTNGYLSPNSRVPDVVIHFSGFFGPRSFHPQGANVGAADGSVRFLSSTTDAAVVRALHSRNGGEPIGGGL